MKIWGEDFCVQRRETVQAEVGMEGEEGDGDGEQAGEGMLGLCEMDV